MEYSVTALELLTAMQQPNIESQVSRVQQLLSEGTPVRVHGPAGSGRGTVASALENQPDVLRLQLLEATEADAPGVACLQVASLLSAQERPTMSGARPRDYEAAAATIMERLAGLS